VEFGLDAVINLIIDEVMENRGQGGMGVGVVKKPENVVEGVELAALEGHDLVDDNGNLFDIATLASDSQALGGFRQGLNQPMDHTWCHRPPFGFDYCFNDISMSSYPHPFSFIWSNQWQSKCAK
jgi:hypothetical protein